MLQAILKGKISREIENMEDVLTSNVFGLMQYISPTNGLLPYLALSENTEGDKPLSWLTDMDNIDTANFKFEFWPWWQEKKYRGCEPDLVIRLDSINNVKLIILIEAKYFSGKSSEADLDVNVPTDQLGREWVNLVSIANSENREPILIYLTAHYGYPEEDIAEAVSELAKKNINNNPTIYWLSWRHLNLICNDSHNLVLQDIFLLLKRLNLRFFNGIKFSYKKGKITWSYTQSVRRYDWDSYKYYKEIDWRFIQ